MEELLYIHFEKINHHTQWYNVYVLSEYIFVNSGIYIFF